MKRAIFSIICAVALCAFSLGVGPSEAISNLGEPWPEPGTIGDIRAVLPGETYANTFWTGAGSFAVNAVVLEHVICCGDPASRRSFRVTIYKEVTTPPFPNITVIGELGAAVADPTPTQWPGQTEYVRYSPLTAFLLEPYSLYWVAASEPVDGVNEAGLLFAVTSGYSGVCNWQLGPSGWRGYVDSDTGEQRWGPDFERLKFKIEATPADGEPSPCNQPPDVSKAHVTMPTIWPPNSEMVPFHIDGVTDPDGDAVTISIVLIEQDEPVRTPDLDATTPDGIWDGTESARIRRERLETGNGRVYKITFQASDGKPNSVSTGVVFVGVPHDQGLHSVAIDDGPENGYYNSRDQQF